MAPFYPTSSRQWAGPVSQIIPKTVAQSHSPRGLFETRHFRARDHRAPRCHRCKNSGLSTHKCTDPKRGQKAAPTGRGLQTVSHRKLIGAFRLVPLRGRIGAMRTRSITRLNLTPRFFLSPLGAPAMAPADEPGAIFDGNLAGTPVFSSDLIVCSQRTEPRFQPDSHRLCRISSRPVATFQRPSWSPPSSLCLFVCS